MNDLPARIDPTETAIGPPSTTARRLVDASVSPNTRRVGHRAQLHGEGRHNARGLDTADQIAAMVRGAEGQRLRYEDLIDHAGRKATVV